MSISTEPMAGRRREMDRLLTRLYSQLESHRAELSKEGMDGDLAWLAGWITRFHHGESDAEPQPDGPELKMLASIRNKLAQAVLEEQRMEAESPLSSAASETHTATMRDMRREVGRTLDAFLKLQPVQDNKDAGDYAHS